MQNALGGHERTRIASKTLATMALPHSRSQSSQGVADLLQTLRLGEFTNSLPLESSVRPSGAARSVSDLLPPSLSPLLFRQRSRVVPQEEAD